MKVELYKQDKINYALRINDTLIAILKIDENNCKIKLDKLLEEIINIENETHVVKELYPIITESSTSKQNNRFEIKEYNELLSAGNTEPNSIYEICRLEELSLYIIDINSKIYLGHIYLAEDQPKMTIQGITDINALNNPNLTFSVNLDVEGYLELDDNVTFNLMLLNNNDESIIV